jgi:hypothetical protein
MTKSHGPLRIGGDRALGKGVDLLDHLNAEFDAGDSHPNITAPTSFKFFHDEPDGFPTIIKFALRSPRANSPNAMGPVRDPLN